MLKRLSILLILSISFLYSQQRGLPRFILGSAATSYIQNEDSIVVKKLRMGKRLADDIFIASGNEKTFLLICNETLLELHPNTNIMIDRSDENIRLLEGNIVIHREEEMNTFCYNIVLGEGSVGYIGSGRLKLSINYSEQVLTNGTFYPKTDYLMVDKAFIKEARRDGKYILSLIYQYGLPSLQKGFNLPSMRNNNLKFSTREKTGSASYHSDTYFHAGSYLKLRMKEFEFVYNLWVAISPSEGFYTGNWDEWQDIINNIHYLQIFLPTDPFYLRIGMIDKLEFGRGYLLDNYNNSIILPFENLSGIRVKSGNKNFLSQFFLNDLTRPRIGGMYLNKRISKKFYADLTYVGDINQYSNIFDSDNDSYPDKVDPQPNVKNTETDSIIVADDPISLDDVKKSQLHAVGLGVKYQIGVISSSDIFITGDLGMLSTPGVGISFPNLFIGNSLFEFGIGADFQSPSFLTSIFDRSYEYNKARFIKNEDGEYKLVSRAKAIEDEDWYRGWNTFFNLNLAKQLTLKSKYREVNRGDDYYKHVTFSLKSRYSFSEKLRSYSFFLDHKDFDKIFKERTDGQSVGFKILLRPHVAIDVSLRFRQQYRDENGDGEIQDDDVLRNYSLNILLDSNYWWKKYKNRKK